MLIASANDADAQIAQSAMPKEGKSAASAYTVRTDVFWCDGDELANQRLDRANRIADVISSIEEPVDGVAPGPVRVRVLPKKVNAQDRYRLDDDVVFHDRDSKSEQMWAEILNEKAQAATGQGLEVRPTDYTSPNYASVFICTGALASRVRARVYVQIGSQTQRDMADKISRYISQKVPMAMLSKGVEFRSDSPADTEIRYFADREQPTAVEIGKVMQDLLRHSVAVTFVPGYEAKLAGAPVIELWYGSKEDLAQVVIESGSE